MIQQGWPDVSTQAMTIYDCINNTVCISPAHFFKGWNAPIWRRENRGVKMNLSEMKKKPKIIQALGIEIIIILSIYLGGQCPRVFITVSSSFSEIDPSPSMSNKSNKLFMSLRFSWESPRLVITCSTWNNYNFILIHLFLLYRFKISLKIFRLNFFTSSTNNNLSYKDIG